MRHFRVGGVPFVGLCALAFLGGTAAAQDAASIEGSWKLVQQESLGPEGWVDKDRQPSLITFADGYYSIMYVPGVGGKSKPRELFSDTANLTSAQKAEAWDTIRANSGTYEVSGSEITFKVLVANSPNLMDGGSFERRFKVEGDTLTTEGAFVEGGPTYRKTYKRLK